MVGFRISGTRFSLFFSLSLWVAADDLATRGGCHFCNVTGPPHWPAGSSSWQWWWHPAREGTTNAMKLNCAESLLVCWTIGSDWFFARILIPIGFICSNCQFSNKALKCEMVITFFNSIGDLVTESVSDVLISVSSEQCRDVIDLSDYKSEDQEDMTWTTRRQRQRQSDTVDYSWQNEKLYS